MISIVILEKINIEQSLIIGQDNTNVDDDIFVRRTERVQKYKYLDIKYII